MKIDVLRKSLFAVNDRAAEENRALLARHGVVALNIMGGAGCGKTTLLEKIIPAVRGELAVGVLEGDLATTKDADRIAALGVPVIQLLTEGGCHLTATLVQEGLRRLPLADLDLLLIENVGNPICPANFDLGEHFRLAVLSVSEGDDKPAKYPYLFKKADAVAITKVDVLAATDFNLDRAMADIRVLGPAKPIFAVSARRNDTGALTDWVRSRCGSVASKASSSR